MNYTDEQRHRGEHLEVGMLVQNRRRGKGAAHAIQKLLSIDRNTGDAVVERINTNGMKARVKCANLDPCETAPTRNPGSARDEIILALEPRKLERRDNGQTTNTRFKAVWAMADQAEQTAKQSNGQTVERTLKDKDLRLSKEALIAHIYVLATSPK